MVIKAPRTLPEKDEDWARYRKRVEPKFKQLQSLIQHVMGVSSTRLVAANSIRASVTPDQVQQLQTQKEIEFLELDPLVQLTYMDDAVEDIDLETYRNNHNPSGGSGVRVAVLDSGIDEQHPAMNVLDGVSTCGEDTDMPGSHGTHCAGSIASQDSAYGGVAPDVDLLNIKVLRANGTGRHTYITQGIDEALNRSANVLSMSVGFNHLFARNSWARALSQQTPRTTLSGKER